MAVSAAVKDLARRLDRPAAELAPFDTLTKARLAVLADGFAAAQKAQRAELDRAIDQALGHLPALLRGPVVRILRG